MRRGTRVIFRLLFFAVMLPLIAGVFMRNTVSAVSRTMIRAEDATATAGSITEVRLSVQGNPGILGARIEITYPSGLELLGVENGEAFSALALTPPGSFQSPCAFVWDGTSLEPGDIRDGTILTLRFKISSNLSEGAKLPISLAFTDGDIVDNNLAAIPLTVSGGVLTIKGYSVRVPDISFATGKIDNGSVTLRVYSLEAYPQLTAILSAYSTMGRLEWCDFKETDLSAGDNTISFPHKSTAASYKVFLLSPSLTPCCQAVTILSSGSYTVRFIDNDGSLLSEQYIAPGKSAVPPQNPIRDGYAFSGWNGTYTNVMSDQTVMARYEVDQTPTITVSEASAVPGAGNVAVTISIRNNPGILGMSLKLDYDGNCLSLTKAENGDAIHGVLNLTSPGELRPQCNFVWDGVAISQSQIRDGALLTLYFDVSPVALGTYPITITYEEDDIVDGSLTAIMPKVQNGSITVK